MKTSALRRLVLAFTLYFGVLLVPEWYPDITSSIVYVGFLFTLPFALLVLALTTVIGVAGLGVAWIRNQAARAGYRSLLQLSVLGFAVFGGSYFLAGALARGLPQGSHVLDFDAGAWKQAGAEPTGVTVTVRQKMLGDVVRNVLPHRSRQEIEALLGPSLDTFYAAESGRDLIYLLGRQRNSIFAIDSEWLLIWLDDSGRFERFQIHTD